MVRCSFILFVLLMNSLCAEPLRLESGVKKNTLIELYTSEGCSSCPPAEDYLNSLKNNHELWKKWVPVAFNVYYWDYICWRDRYACKKFCPRQSLYASLRRASTVYTPAFMVNGLSWRRGIFSSALPEEKASAGNLVVSIKGKSVHTTYESVKKSPLKLNIAVLGMGLMTHIKRGENAGRTASHEFVVIGFSSANSNKSKSNNYEWNMQLPELHYSQAKKYAVAIWVSEVKNPAPLQVVGGLLPNYKK
jgi:hypothetical protein